MNALSVARLSLLCLFEDRCFGLNGIQQAPFSDPGWFRAGGDTVCSVCGKVYYDHATFADAPWITLLCNGDRVKL